MFYRAAAASWFLRLGELGSVVRALAASSSLLDDMEMVFRLETTCVWSSLDWRETVTYLHLQLYHRAAVKLLLIKPNKISRYIIKYDLKIPFMVTYKLIFKAENTQSLLICSFYLSITKLFKASFVVWISH